MTSTFAVTVRLSGLAPVGLGTDFNGFAGLPSPRFGPDACVGGSSAVAASPVAYPFVAAATGPYHVFAIAKTWQALLPVVLLFQARITLRQVLNYFHEWFVAGRAYR